MLLRTFTLIALFLGFAQLPAQTIVNITDASLQGGQTYNWTKNNVYLLDGYVYLESGGVLNIEAGTRIEAKNTPNSALIITRGAQIFAEGTKEEPIIFTAEGEDGNFGNDDRGSWGGVIVLGNGTVGDEDGIGTSNIEGITAEERTTYGGGLTPNDDDNSGVLRYVSIRYAGIALTGDNEINGLTLGGVGRNTTVEFIEIFGNKDDGIEVFGGAVNLKYIIAAFCADDGFDTDQNWSGSAQFVFVIQVPNEPEANNVNGGEHDGSENPADNGGALQRVYNATYIGMGADMDNGNGNSGLRLKNAVAISYVNSIFTEFGRFGLDLEDEATTRYLNDEFQLTNNIFWNFGEGNSFAEFVNASNGSGDQDAAVIAELQAEGSEAVNPQLAGISYTPNGMLDPRPSVGSPALQNVADVPEDDDFLESTSYRGAFSFGNNWALGWTTLDELGYFGDLVDDRPTRIITDAELVGNTTYSWSADTLYFLDGFVYLEEGGVLNIAPGTVIQATGSPTNSDNTSALIITRGARINAIGTADDPIIFTAEGEDGNFSLPNDGGPFAADDRGSWGGLIILGRATVGDEDGLGFSNIEGIPVTNRTRYGGESNPNDDDNSGTLRYVSILYGGKALSGDNEVNGLTLGGVGRGTSIEYIEIFGNADDGIEFFGGTVDVKHAVAAFCADDAFDTDQNWAGRGQYWFAIQTPNDPVANNINGGEHDGSEDPADNGGLLQTVYNATYIGMGQNADNGSGNSGLRIKNAAAITYGNSIFTEFGRFGLDLEDEAVMRYLADDFQFPSNIWWNFGEGNTPEQFVNAETQEAAVITKLLGEGNIVADPLLYNISWTPSTNSGLDGNGTDPRLLSTSPATGNAADVPDGDFYDDVDYRGAFAPDATGSDYWITWTHAFRMGYFVNLPLSTTEFGSNGSGVALSVPAPNPATSTTRMTIDLPAAGLVSATIFDQLGRQISRRDLGLLSAGENNVTLDVQSLPNGNYFIVIDTELGKVAQRVVVNR